MTVTEIREYVDELKQFYRWLPAGYPCSSSDIAHKLLKVRAMLYQLEQEQKDQLDELEPNENTSQWVQHYEICGYVCDNCGHISEIKDNVCSNCGAIMNDELKENNK